MSALSTESSCSISEMEARVRRLESELAAARAVLTVTRTREFAGLRTGQLGADTIGNVRTAAPGPHRVLPFSGVGREQPVTVPPSPVVLLKPLLLHDPLRRKWKLGAGLPLAGSCADVYRSPEGNRAPTGSLYVYGLLADGEPWEQLISFSALAADGGVIIGRDADMCHVVLDDESVSRMHARLEINQHGLVVSDLNSMNGVYVDDVQVDGYTPQTRLTDGAILTLGSVPLRVEMIVSR